MRSLPTRCVPGRRRRAASWSLLPFLLAGCGEGGVASWCAPPAEGVEVAFNEGPGEWEREGRSPRLTEIWRSGPDGGFRLPVAIAVSEGGRLAVMDFGSAQVYGFASDGVFQGALLPPGAAEGPVAVAWADDGELAVLDVLAARVLFVEPGERVSSELPVDSAFVAPAQREGMSWVGVLPDGTTLLHPLIDVDPDREDPSRQETVVLRLPAGSAEVDTIAAQEVRTLAPGFNSRLRAPGWPFPRLAVGPGGLAVGGMDARYRIVIRDPSGTPVRQVCRDAAGHPLRPDERGLEGDSLSRINRSLRRVEKPDRPTPYARLVLGTDGALWVQRDRPDPTADEAFGRPGARYDVFDPAGGYMGEVRAPEGVSFHAAAGDTVWGFDSGGGATVLVAYRLEAR